MKKIIAFGFSTMLLFSACSNDMKDAVDNVPVPQSGLQYMEFTASAGTDTRTELTSDNKVVWQAGDEISIFDGTSNRKFTTKDGGANAVFCGYAANAGTYYALYPYLEGATLEGNVIKNVTLPSEQTAKAGSFDTPYNISVASASASSGLQLAFDNVCSLVKFSVGNSQASKIRKVKLTDKTAVLTATVDITLGNQPTATPTSGQQATATLIADNGLEAGQYYYFTVLPTVLSTGFSLIFFDDEGKFWKKGYNEDNAVRSRILNLAAIKVGDFKSSLLTNKNLIAAVEESTGETFTKNTDGSVPVLNDDNYRIVGSVRSIDVSGKGDPSVCEDIGLFINLNSLYCGGNEITSLDLSKNTLLETLDCHSNQLTSLDLPANANALRFTELDCSYNQLTSLDISNIPAMKKINCGSNKLTSLDLPDNVGGLIELDCSYNKLTSLNVSNGVTKLNCSVNQLTSLDIPYNLTVLNCSYNKLTSLNLSNGVISNGVTKLDCTGNQLTSLDLSKNTALTLLDCGRNQLRSLDVSKNTALTRLACNDNQLTSLDTSNNTELTELYCHNNMELRSLDVTKNTKLTRLCCHFISLASLDLSKNTALTLLDCRWNYLSSLDLTMNTRLEILYCNENNLTSLDISNNNRISWNELAVGNQKNNQILNLFVNANQITNTLHQVIIGMHEPNKNVNILLKSDTTP